MGRWGRHSCLPASTVLRMTIRSMNIRETYTSYIVPNCHPEEAALPARDSSAGRLTKDLLRHRLTSRSLVFNRRNRRHVHQATQLLLPPAIRCLSCRSGPTMYVPFHEKRRLRRRKRAASDSNRYRKSVPHRAKKHQNSAKNQQKYPVISVIIQQKCIIISCAQ